MVGGIEGQDDLHALPAGQRVPIGQWLTRKNPSLEQRRDFLQASVIPSYEQFITHRRNRLLGAEPGSIGAQIKGTLSFSADDLDEVLIRNACTRHSESTRSLQPVFRSQ